ncbi:MAG: DUF1549 domain-containing protein [Verrucomicrobiota bacterium]
MRPVLAIAVLLPFAFVASAASRVDYDREVKPLLRERCHSCHGALKQKGGLRLDTAALAKKGGDSGPAVVPRKPESSPLMEKVATADSKERMPPEGDPLTPEQIELLKRWIAQGAPAPPDEMPEQDPRQHWAFVPPSRPALPKVRGSQFEIRNPIDSFIAAEQQERRLKPLPAAEKNVLLRRVYLDLIGLPPTREELHAFQADISRDAYERVVDRLLDDPRYGERWARHWMDVWRYADWFGRRQVPDVWNSAPQIWRWRDWIVRSLNTDKGYDRMVMEMLAGDEVAPNDDATTVATGYLVRNWYALNHNQWMRDNVEHTGKAFLGLTFNCAHCHDHKYDPITQQDYFAFRAFFEPIYVRQDRWPGEADPGPFQDYNYSVVRKVQRLGMVRVFDKNADLPTWFYTGGDERNRQTNRPPVAPSMPQVLGGSSLRIASIALPEDAYYPGSRDWVQESELAARRTALASAETELMAAKNATTEPNASLREALAKAEAAFNQAVAEAKAAGKPTALAGGQSLLLDATTGRRILNHPLTGLKELPEGTAIRLKLQLLTDKHANFQLAKDTSAGLTAAYIGFNGGKILSYQPGTTKEFEAGQFVFTNGQTTFELRLVLEPKVDRALLTVTSLTDGQTLVNETPVAINGWNPTQNPKQGITLDAQTGAVAVWDDLVIAPREGEPFFRWDFEPPTFLDGKDIVDVDGWSASSFSAAPATSTVSAIACQPSLCEKQQAVNAVRRAIDLPTLAITAAQTKLVAARADLSGVQARIAADRAKFAATNEFVTLARAASQSEREAAVLSAKAKVAAANHAFASAEARPLADKTRAKALQTAAKQLADAEGALKKAEAARSDSKLAETYTPFTPIYPEKSTGRRKALGEWIGSRDNPLTARVAVNHIWLRHFHAPLVSSVFDFGRNGARPTHPALLDWLAVEFMESGWSMKHLHRLTVTSAAYRRAGSVESLKRSNVESSNASRFNTSTLQRITSANRDDPENKWYWRMNAGRMEAEILRDSVLHLAGLLDTRMGGQELENKDMPTTNRRSLYYACYPEAGGNGEFTAMFDAPDPNECYRRPRSVVPQQALALTNSKLVHDQSVALTKRLWTSLDERERSEPAVFITAAYEQILGHQPKREELQECQAFLAKQAAANEQTKPDEKAARARESLIRALLNHNDFLTIR